MIVVSSAPVTIGDGAVATNVYTPWIAGEPKAGWTLTANPGTWSPSDVTVKYQWLVDGKAVAGATGKTFAPSAEHVGKRVAVKVTASKPGYDSASVRFTHADKVLPADAAAKNVNTPWIAGEPRVGWTLTANPGTWNPVDATFTYQWLVDGQPVSGATGRRSRPRPRIRAGVSRSG